MFYEGAVMGQVTIYLDDEIEQRMVEAAKSAHLSKSKWIAGLIREKVANEWPQSSGKLAGMQSNSPPIEEAESGKGDIIKQLEVIELLSRVPVDVAALRGETKIQALTEQLVIVGYELEVLIEELEAEDFFESKKELMDSLAKYPKDQLARNLVINFQPEHLTDIRKSYGLNFYNMVIGVIVTTCERNGLITEAEIWRTYKH